MASTTHEALIAELLGDVGKLHDGIKALPQTINENIKKIHNEIEAIPTSLQSSVGAIVKVTQETEKAIELYADTAKKSIKDHVAVETALSDAIKALTRSAKAYEENVKAAHSTIKTLFIAFVVGFCGALLGMWGVWVVYGQQIATNAAWGRGLSIAWNQLDQKTQKIITTAKEAQK
jgi:hypothetical protein